MALVLADRVKETTTSIGTGNIILAGASTGFQAFAVIGNNNTTYYTIAGGTQWEVGIGTYTTSGPTLTRTTVLASSTGGAAIDFSAGTKDVFVTYPAGYSANAVGGGIGAINLNASEVTVNASINTGQNGFSVGPITVASGKSVTVASGQRWVVF